jgi:hypothetical protein
VGGKQRSFLYVFTAILSLMGFVRALNDNIFQGISLLKPILLNIVYLKDTY